MRLYSMNAGYARARMVPAGAVVAAVALITGCGSQYRPVVTPVNSSGPAAQPTSYAVVVSAPSTITPGIVTIIDYSGDTVMAQAPIGPGPTTFTIDQSGTTGYTVNSDGTITNFPITTSLQAKMVTYTTLLTTSKPVGLFSPSAGLWIADQDGNIADVFNGSPQTFKLAIPVATAPVTIVGPSVYGQRNYAISQGFDAPSGTVPNGVACNLSPTTAPVNGESDALETSTNTVSARIPLGKCPVYAVQGADNKRFFVLNRGSDTVTVINSQNNTLNSCTPFVNQNGQTVTCHPTLPLSTAAVTATGITPPNGTSGMTLHAGPVYAEYSAPTSQLVVSNYDGNTISVIDVSLDEFGNDSSTFGTTFTIPVGRNPASVTVLADATRAYTANQSDGTVTIVNLSSYTVEKTLPVIGHPRTVVSTQNSSYGKVYAASPDSPYLTIIRTDQDIVDTTVLIEGNIVDVRVTTSNAVSGNSNSNSRSPGHGQPCYLPGATAAATLASCRTMP